MDSQRWHRLSELFLELIDLPREARGRRLDEVGAGDPVLRDELAAMLAAHDDPGELAIERRLLDREGGSPLDPLPEGTRVGRYALGPLVGEGGMGEVYRAERMDGTYRQTVALKLLRPGFLAADAVRRFRTERQLLARLTHPLIVPILDGGTAEDGRPYLVLQYVDGVPITRWCDERRLDLEGRLRLFQRVAEAVQFAHGRLVIHRDLKPSNILVEADGTPRLLDFGIAKLLDADPEGTAGLTRAEGRLLTPEHAAPEQLRGEPCDTATDVYGLGVLLYELLAGRRPFQATGRTPEDFARTILTQPAPAPSAVAAGAVPGHRLRGDLDRIVAMALRKEPERRYRTAGELAEDVERFLDGRPVRARPDTLGYRSRKFVARNRSSVAAAVAATAALLAFTVTTRVQARQVAAERDRAEGERAAAEEVVEILTSLFQRSNPRLFPGGDTLPVSALVDDAEARLDGLAEQPERHLALVRAVGALRTARGEHARARDLLATAWATHGSDEGLSPRDRANLYHEWAMAVLAADGVAEGSPMLETSLEMHRDVVAPDHPDLAIVLADRAAAEADPERRAELLAEARRIREVTSGPEGVEFAAQLNAEGTAFYLEGRLEQAVARFEESLEILARDFPPEHPNRLAVTNNLVASLVSLARWEEAEGLLRRKAAVESVAGAPDARAATLELLGLIHAHRGRFDEAEVALRASLDLARDSAASRLANTWRNLGVVLDLDGRSREGLAALDSALATLTSQGAPDPAEVAIMETQRALVLLGAGRAAEAAVLAPSAADRVRDALPVFNARRTEAELWAGIVALGIGDDAGAETRFTAALAGAEASSPAGHPRIATARCALEVTRIRLGRGDRTRNGLAEPCEAMADWGLVHPVLLDAARRARQGAGAP